MRREYGGLLHAGGFKRYEGLLPFGLRLFVRGSHAFIPEKLIRCFSHLICRFQLPFDFVLARRPLSRNLRDRESLSEAVAFAPEWGWIRLSSRGWHTPSPQDAYLTVSAGNA